MPPAMKSGEEAVTEARLIQNVIEGAIRAIAASLGTSQTNAASLMTPQLMIALSKRLPETWADTIEIEARMVATIRDPKFTKADGDRLNAERRDVFARVFAEEQVMQRKPS